jgi:hypothetical protein
MNLAGDLLAIRRLLRSSDRAERHDAGIADQPAKRFEVGDAAPRLDGVERNRRRPDPIDDRLRGFQAFD